MSQPTDMGQVYSGEEYPDQPTSRNQGMKKDSVTIRDVAAAAGVSKSAVSKYLTSTPYVSDAVRQRIEKAIADLNYEPNRAARTLVRGRSGLIGVLIPSFSNPYQSDLLDGIDDAAGRLGHSLLIASADRDSKRAQKAIRGLLSSGADGLVISSAQAHDPEIIDLYNAGTPIILAGRHTTDVDVDYVVADNALGGKLAADHLLNLGHRTLAYIGGPDNVLDFRERLSGFEKEITDRGFELPTQLILTGPPTPKFGREATDIILSLPEKSRPSAVFASADWVAIGVLAQARRRGVSVPGELSVVGFDDISLNSTTDIPLTTINAQPITIGETALKLLVERMYGSGQPGQPTQHVITPTLVWRESTVEARSREVD